MHTVELLYYIFLTCLYGRPEVRIYPSMLRKSISIFLITVWFPRFHLFPGTMMYSGNISMIFSAPYVVLMFMPRYGSWHLFIWISILSDLFHKMFGRNARMYQWLVHFLFVISCSSISFITYLAKGIWQYAEWNTYDSNDKDSYIEDLFPLH